jgi:hypothetical protein
MFRIYSISETNHLPEKYNRKGFIKAKRNLSEYFIATASSQTL